MNRNFPDIGWNSPTSKRAAHAQITGLRCGDEIGRCLAIVKGGQLVNSVFNVRFNFLTLSCEVEANDYRLTFAFLSRRGAAESRQV